MPVWAFYPESSQRALEEMDLLFAANKPWVWTAESNFKALKAGHGVVAEKGLEDLTVHAETAEV